MLIITEKKQKQYSSNRTLTSAVIRTESNAYVRRIEGWSEEEFNQKFEEVKDVYDPAGRRATMLYAGSSPVATKVLVSTDIKAISSFLKENSTNHGFTVQYAVTEDGRVIELFKKGKIAQRDIKALAPLGITEWHYSHAWAGDKWIVDGGIVERQTIEVNPQEINDFVVNLR